MYRSTQLVALVALVALVVSILLAPSAFADESAHVDLRELAKSAAQFVGKRVTTHGCLVKHFHGSFVHLCGSHDWHELVLVQDPDYRVPATFQRLGIDYSRDIQGDFSGVVVEVEVAHPKPDKHPFLRLDSVANAAPYEP
jgi:hypothetical protein